MNNKTILLIHVILGFGIPVGILGYSLMTGVGGDSLLFGAILMLCMIPTIAFGMYMWVTGRGQMWINGVNWKALDEAQATRTVRLMGILMALMCLAIYASLCLLFIDFMIFIVVLVAILVGFGYVIYYVNSKKYRAKSAGAPTMSMNTMLAISVAVLAVSAVPAVYLCGAFGDGNINVDLADDHISIEGPMFKEEFKYTDIDDYYIDMTFDKGKRTNGFGTSTIASGHFWNLQFGDYMLASYTQVKPCIVLVVNGDHYVFNQSTAELTQQMMDDLTGKMPVPPSPPVP